MSKCRHVVVLHMSFNSGVWGRFNILVWEGTLKQYSPLILLITLSLIWQVTGVVRIMFQFKTFAFKFLYWIVIIIWRFSFSCLLCNGTSSLVSFFTYNRHMKLFSDIVSVLRTVGVWLNMTDVWFCLFATSYSSNINCLYLLFCEC